MPCDSWRYTQAVCFTIMIPDRRATAEATPILWASKSSASDELEFKSRGVGTSCSTTEPVIRLTTAKVPEKRGCHLSNSRKRSDRHLTEIKINAKGNGTPDWLQKIMFEVKLMYYLWTHDVLYQKPYREPQGRRMCKGQISVPQTWAKQRPYLFMEEL